MYVCMYVCMYNIIMFIIQQLTAGSQFILECMHSVSLNTLYTGSLEVDRKLVC